MSCHRISYSLNTDVELTVAKDHREARLRRELDRIKDNYEYIFIDCPPALSWHHDQRPLPPLTKCW